MYHEISETNHLDEKRYALPPSRFRSQVQYLRRNGYTPISLDDLHDHFILKGKRLPPKPVIVTLDDGYKDNYQNAFPILKEYNIPAILFIVSGHVGNKNNWITNEAYPERPLMSWSEIDEMRRNGILIGSHTVHHHRLTEISPDAARFEIEDSKKCIEDRLGIAIHHFAYPHGDMNEAVLELVKKAGYKTACSTRSGFNSEEANLLELRRLEVYGTDLLWQFALKLTYGTNDGNLVLPAKYYMKRLSEKLLPNKSIT